MRFLHLKIHFYSKTVRDVNPGKAQPQPTPSRIISAHGQRGNALSSHIGPFPLRISDKESASRFLDEGVAIAAHSTDTDFRHPEKQVRMVVRTLSRGLTVTGLHVGINNVRRYFPKRITVIELHLDHLQIQCGLSPDFWNGEPEIRDLRLCAWLEAKNFRGNSNRTPLPMVMIPAGENSFRLQTISMTAHSRLRQPIQPAQTALPEPTLISAA
jgi:hypothetical protein